METEPTQSSTQARAPVALIDERESNRVELETSSLSTAVLALVGEHDLAQHAMLRAGIDRAASRRRHLVIDLSRCAFIDSTTISLLLYAQDEVASDGGRIALVVAPGASPVADVVEVTHLAELIPIYPSLASAREALEPGDA